MVATDMEALAIVGDLYQYCLYTISIPFVELEMSKLGSHTTLQGMCRDVDRVDSLSLHSYHRLEA